MKYLNSKLTLAQSAQADLQRKVNANVFLQFVLVHHSKSLCSSLCQVREGRERGNVRRGLESEGSEASML